MFYSDLIDVLPKYLKSAFSIAYAAATASQGTSGKHKNSYKLGAVLFTGSIPSTVSSNSYKTHPTLAKYTIYPFRHAESSVMLRHGLDRCCGNDLFVVRVRKNGALAMAKPCQVCQKFMHDFGINRCFYTSEKGWHVL